MNEFNVPLTSDEIDILLQALNIAQENNECIDWNDRIKLKLIDARERVNNG